MTVKLVHHTDKILHSVLEPFDFATAPEHPIEIANKLIGCMAEEGGIGLAANQVGLPYRLFVMRGEPMIVCFNPRIVDVSEEQVLLEEGCLSYPGMLIKVKRPKKIKVRFANEYGEVITRTFDGMSARCFQHELDHLDGVTMLERATPIHRDMAMRKWKIYQKKVDRRK